jgi:hypothetical protein
VSQRIHPTTRLAIHFRDEFTCVYCGAAMPDVVLTLDHVDGRSNAWTNLVTACWFCNSSKQDSTVAEFAARHGMDLRRITRRIARRVTRDRQAFIIAARNVLRREPPPWLIAMRQASQEAALRARRGEACPPPSSLACPFCLELQRPDGCGCEAAG